MQSKTDWERRMAAAEVCKLRGLVRDRIDETNDIGEGPLLAAAADGAGPGDLRALILAMGVDKVSAVLFGVTLTSA